jgi:hypothetical protein
MVNLQVLVPKWVVRRPKCVESRQRLLACLLVAKKHEGRATGLLLEEFDPIDLIPSLVELVLVIVDRIHHLDLGPLLAANGRGGLFGLVDLDLLAGGVAGLIEDLVVADQTLELLLPGH